MFFTFILQDYVLKNDISVMIIEPYMQWYSLLSVAE